MLLSFCAHYYIDGQYHAAGLWLGRFFGLGESSSYVYPPLQPELRLRGDRFLLGSASWHLSQCRTWRIFLNICCVAATSPIPRRANSFTVSLSAAKSAGSC